MCPRLLLVDHSLTDKAEILGSENPHSQVGPALSGLIAKRMRLLRYLLLSLHVAQHADLAGCEISWKWLMDAWDLARGTTAVILESRDSRQVSPSSCPIELLKSKT